MITPDHPFPSVKDSLLPGTLTDVKIFASQVGIEDLEQQCARWVRETGNLIVVPGPPIVAVGGWYTVSVTYVKSKESLDGQEEAVTPGPVRIADRRAPTSSNTPSESNGSAGRPGSGQLRVPELA